MKKPCNSACINLGERSHSLYTDVIKLIKNGVKLGEQTFVLKTRIFKLGIVKKVSSLKCSL